MTILVVDDNEPNLYQLQVLLVGNGYQVVTAVHGAEALSKARQNPPDVIVSDILMPVMDGFTLCREWRKDERLRHVPFVFYTATYTDDRDRELALSLGAERFLVKPEEPEVLLQAIRDVIQPARPAADTPARGAGEAPREGEAVFLKQYSEALVRKLEAKMQQLEQTNRGLEQSLAERKRTEDALRESEERYRLLFDTSMDAVFLTVPDGRILAANRAACDMFGRTEEELRRLGRGAVVDASDPRLAAAIEERARTGRFCGELTFMRSDGTKFPAELSTAIFHDHMGESRTSMVIRDITARKRAEESLVRLATAVEQAAEPISITDTNGVHLYVNPAFERVSGYSRQEALGQTPRILKSGKQDADFYRRMWATLGAGQVWSGRMINKRKDGTLYEVDATISPIRDPMRNIVNYVAVERDVSREAELESQLRHAQKMEAVGRLAGGVAHDFNNLLMGIMGYADLCRAQIAPGHPIREWLDEIKLTAERSAEITRQLLAFARKQVIAPKVMDLNDAVAGMLKLLRRLIGEDIDLAWLPGANLRPVRLDPSQIDQVLANLCVNARDAIAGVGRITLETWNATIDADYCARHVEARPGEYVCLAVSDDGCGMDSETQAHLFEPFFTTKGIGKGTGLGLSTVDGIVKQNNGFIYVYSEPGKGTTFKIYLPQVTKTVMEEVPDAAAVVPKGRGEAVLLVEDEKSLRVTLSAFLEALGYKVLVAETPGEAVETAGRHPGKIHLLLTDVVMPGMDGRQLAQRFESVRPDLKVLFMSGYTADVIAQRSVLERGVAFIAKPFTHDDLARKVHEVLEGPTTTNT